MKYSSVETEWISNVLAHTGCLIRHHILVEAFFLSLKSFVLRTLSVGGRLLSDSNDFIALHIELTISADKWAKKWAQRLFPAFNGQFAFFAQARDYLSRGKWDCSRLRQILLLHFFLLFFLSFRVSQVFCLASASLSYLHVRLRRAIYRVAVWTRDRTFLPHGRKSWASYCFNTFIA